MTHPETQAICARPEYDTWARKNRGSFWDYKLDGESDPAAANRRRTAVWLCAECPLRKPCLARHDALYRKRLETVSPDSDMALVGGVWGGKVFVDRHEQRRPATGAAA